MDLPQTVNAPASSGTMTIPMLAGTMMSITPTGSCTFNATGGYPGVEVVFLFTTSGTTSFTMTFGTNLRSSGPLATGIVSGKKFAVTWRSLPDGVTWMEMSRTVAL